MADAPILGGGTLQLDDAVFGVEFGHTSPQHVLPYGGEITVDGPARRIVAHF